MESNTGIWEHKRRNPENKSIVHDNLEDFNGGKYSSPEFTFYKPAGVTSIKFFNSEKMGLEYKNEIFVGDIKSVLIYRFHLDLDRSLMLDGNLTDKIANSPEELNGRIFAKAFSGISDMEVGPDGYLYILSYGKGTIYRIIPKWHAR
jgi:glucose/arabinose dehydrogenase